jgi:CDP-glucose 4,6-dehydratase
MCKFWQNKKVLLTGHTGFKGSWLVLLLKRLGAEVYGYALEPDTIPSLFVQANLAEQCHHTIGDIMDFTCLQKYIMSVQPEIVFHFAAQSLVRRSYSTPLETWSVNVMGTTHLMESMRKIKHKCAAVIVTTDKVYDNKEWHYAYRETDPLGGYDPYSSSKAAAELAIASWRSSFLNSTVSETRLASARAGNVIGGGDWSEDRIVPDIIHYLSKGTVIPVRNPNAMRPWQHVLEPLNGYLFLAEKLYKYDIPELQSAFNFGPDSQSVMTVKHLVEESLKHWPGKWESHAPADAPHEAELLKLTYDKALSLLGWSPRWSFEQAVRYTINWYHRCDRGEHAIELMQEQIDAYINETDVIVRR